MDEDPTVHRLIGTFSDHLLAQAAQDVACNAAHHLDRRCARLLARIADLLPGRAFEITHDAIARVLGVERPSITRVVRPLAESRIIEHRRGLMRVRDAAALAAAACECYAVDRRSLRAWLSHLQATS